MIDPVHVILLAGYLGIQACKLVVSLRFPFYISHQ